LSTDIRAANLLLIGHAAAAREHLLPMMPSLAEPIVGLDGGDLHLPTEHVGTLLVWDIARLTRTNQEQLLEWMVGRQGSCRIIATSARSLFPDVQDGTFSDALYYRLNTVIVVLPGHKMLAASRRDRTILRRA
jgi:sigma54-dependent transcription regulator